LTGEETREERVDIVLTGKETGEKGVDVVLASEETGEERADVVLAGEKTGKEKVEGTREEGEDVVLSRVVESVFIRVCWLFSLKIK
jgi:hypothetical protein